MRPLRRTTSPQDARPGASKAWRLSPGHPRPRHSRANPPRASEAPVWPRLALLGEPQLDRSLQEHALLAEYRGTWEERERQSARLTASKRRYALNPSKKSCEGQTTC